MNLHGGAKTQDFVDLLISQVLHKRWRCLGPGGASTFDCARRNTVNPHTLQQPPGFEYLVLVYVTMQLLALLAIAAAHPTLDG